MSTQIPTAFIDQFRANFDMLVGQMDSRLVSAVMQERVVGEYFYIDQIGHVLPQRRTTRHSDTPFTEVPHARRRLLTDVWELGEMIDKADVERMLTSPQSAYVRAFAASFARQRDKVILDAMFATAQTGRSGGTNVTFPSSQQIAVDYVEAGSPVTTNLTLGKLRRAIELLGDVGAEDDEIYIAVTRREVSAMLRTPEFGSADFNEARPLVTAGFGQPLPRFMGINWIILPNRVVGPDGASIMTMFQTDGSGHRRIPVWSKRGVAYGQTADTEIQAAVDPSKSFDVRLYGRAVFGATRLEEARVVEIKCSTTAF